MTTDNEPLPTGLSPMLATAASLPHGVGWVYETKWDGVRGLVSISASGQLSIRTRAGNDVTNQFPELASLVRAADGHALVLDGEIVAFDAGGKPNFNRLQGRLGVTGSAAVIRSQDNPVLIAVFDLLHLDGFSTRRLPLENRRSLLEQLDFGRGAHWHLSTLHNDGDALLQITRDAGLEGVVAKKVDSPYLPGVRSKAWIKVRNMNQDTFVVGGWIPGEGRRQDSIGSLLIGVPVDDAGSGLQWVGRVGTGFTDSELTKLRGLLGPLVRPSSPFDADVGDRNAVFTEPRLLISVSYLEYTADGVLRSPSYKGLVSGT